jgi:ATP-dependent Clp protease ATP-binding subunit ClpX
MDIGTVLDKINFSIRETKGMELYFFKNHDINIVLEEERHGPYHRSVLVTASVDLGPFTTRNWPLDFEHGLKLVKEKTGRNRFFITREALER